MNILTRIAEMSKFPTGRVFLPLLYEFLYESTRDCRVPGSLKTCTHPGSVAARWSNRISGEKAAKIDHIQAIVQIFHIDLPGGLEFFFGIKVPTERQIHRKLRLHSTTVKIHTINHCRPVLRQDR